MLGNATNLGQEKDMENKMMEELLLCESEYKLMNLIWDYAPIESGKLVKICELELSWKKSTMYTILRKLCAKNIIINEDSIVKVVVPREKVQKIESKHVIEKSFGGSLPAFVSAFLGNGKISENEAEQLIELINKHKDLN